MKNIAFSLLGFSILCLMPFSASADEVNLQDASTVITQDGEGNKARVDVEQSIRTNTSRSKKDNYSSGNVQTYGVDALQVGTDNETGVTSRQEIKTRSRSYRNRKK